MFYKQQLNICIATSQRDIAVRFVQLRMICMNTVHSPLHPPTCSLGSIICQNKTKTGQVEKILQIKKASAQLRLIVEISSLAIRLYSD